MRLRPGTLLRRATTQYAVEEVPQWQQHPPCPLCGRVSGVGKIVAEREAYYCRMCAVEYCRDGAVFRVTLGGALLVVRESEWTLEQKRKRHEQKARAWARHKQTRVDVESRESKRGAAARILPREELIRLLGQGMKCPQISVATGIDVYLVEWLKRVYGLTVSKGRGRFALQNMDSGRG